MCRCVCVCVCVCGRAGGESSAGTKRRDVERQQQQLEELQQVSVRPANPASGQVEDSGLSRDGSNTHCSDVPLCHCARSRLLIIGSWCDRLADAVETQPTDNNYETRIPSQLPSSSHSAAHTTQHTARASITAGCMSVSS